MIEEDYTEGDRYDWDHNDARQYCKHGTFIGSWWGPDLLCGECEMGNPDPTIRELRGYKSNVEEAQREWWGSFGKTIAPITRTESELLAPFVKEVVKRHEQQLKHWDDQIAEAEQWASSETDDNWLSKRHAAMRGGE